MSHVAIMSDRSGDKRRTGLPDVQTRTSIAHAAGIRATLRCRLCIASHRGNVEAPKCRQLRGLRAKAGSKMPHETFCHREVKDRA
jgi:hypothetical protein